MILKALVQCSGGLEFWHEQTDKVLQENLKSLPSFFYARVEEGAKWTTDNIKSFLALYSGAHLIGQYCVPVDHPELHRPGLHGLQMMGGPSS